MAKFTMLIGIPASGKSTFAQIARNENENTRILSSDMIREAVLGDVGDQSNNALVFNIMNKQTIDLLEQGYDIVYDATNTSSKRRMALLKTLPKDTYKEAVYFPCSYGNAISRDSRRGISVGSEVIKKMYKGLDVPMFHEGFDSIEYYKHRDSNYELFDLSSLLKLVYPYEKYIGDFMHGHQELLRCVDFAQDNPHHTLSVSRHMHRTVTYLVDKLASERLVMAAALHDCGKPTCRAYKDDGYACFYGHDKVSAQMAVNFLYTNQVKFEDITHVSTLINLHMRMHQEEGRAKLKALVGEEMYKDLELLYEADSKAK